MIERDISQESGFSAAELLITLFIGTLFLISGIQLYIFIFANGTASGQTARASNLAYELLKEYESSPDFVHGPCVADTITPTISDTHDLSNVSASIVVECPYTSVSLQNISKVTVTVNYKAGSSMESVKHATYMS